MRRTIGASVNLVVFLLMSVGPQASSANQIYTYTGNNFNSFRDDTPPAGAYTSSMNVSGMFELASALPANTSFGTVTPLSFSFTDDRNVITSSTPNLRIDYFQIETDALGNISHWNMLVVIQAPGSYSWYDIRTTNCVACVAAQYRVQDFVETVAYAGVYIDQAGASPGAWTRVPEPGTLALLGLGLAGLGLSRRRRAH